MPTATENTTRVIGTVIDLHPKSGDNWSRAKVQFVDGRTAWVTAKFRIEKGETFDAFCNFNEKYKSYDCVSLAAGENGEVSNEVVILKLVEILQGVGKVKARRLGEKFPNLYEILISTPEKIAEACGASLTDVKLVYLKLTAERSELSRVTTLVSKGWPNHLAKRVAKNDKAYTVAVKSPYAAIKLVDGLGWLLADEIGRKQGIALEDPSRVEAGIDHYYREEVTGDGHTLVHEDVLIPGASDLLGVKKGLVEEKAQNVLLPRGDGWYTSKRHYDNATIISEFFLPPAPQGAGEVEDRAGGEENLSE